MDQRMIIVCSVVGSLGVLSAILGFSAEGTKLTDLGDDRLRPAGGGRCVELHRDAVLVSVRVLLRP
ncbi:unnamed protein product [Triticum turgidum subsp. durum]|uniref:Uncharacterized protein n=1 Tax=Triticum turgidum subsp. durum TaxID=4567 RepID=A0A9R0UWT9_TRITD|nr:unnamed protein product [Triticum turgidum subsp. durum]